MPGIPHDLFPLIIILIIPSKDSMFLLLQPSTHVGIPHPQFSLLLEASVTAPLAIIISVEGTSHIQCANMLNSSCISQVCTAISRHNKTCTWVLYEYCNTSNIVSKVYQFLVWKMCLLSSYDIFMSLVTLDTL